MTRHEHHNPFTGSGHGGHLPRRGVGEGLGGGYRSRTGKSESDLSMLSIRNIGDAPDLDDDVGVVSAVGATRALTFKGFRGGKRGKDAGGGSNRGHGNGSAATRSHHRRHLSMSDGGLPRLLSSPSRSPTKGGGVRRRAWTAGDADVTRSIGVGGGLAFAAASVPPIRVLSSDSTNSVESAGSSPSPLDIPSLYAPAHSQPRNSWTQTLEGERRLRPLSPSEESLGPPGDRRGEEEEGRLGGRDDDSIPPSSFSSRLFPRVVPNLAGISGMVVPEEGRGVITESLTPGLFVTNKGDRSFRDEYLTSQENIGDESRNMGCESFEDEYIDTGEEEKRELAPVEERARGNGEHSFDSAWSGVTLLPSLGAHLPPRNESSLAEEEFTDEKVNDSILNARPPSVRPITSKEEPSFGTISGTGTMDSGGDAPVLSSLGVFVDEQLNDHYCKRSAFIADPRFDSLTTSEKMGIARVATLVQSPSDSSAGEGGSFYEDGFEDEGVYYMNSPMQTPQRGMGRGVNDIMDPESVSPGVGSGGIGWTGYDLDGSDKHTGHHVHLGSRHNGIKKKMKTSASFSQNVSIASGSSKKARGDEYQPIYLCGRRVRFLRWPLFRISKPPWSRVSSLIVRHAPCFWCSQRFEIAATDRAILVRLNVLCTCFAAVQVGAGLFLLLVQWSSDGTEEENRKRRESLMPNLWTLNGMVFLLALVGLVLIATMLLTLKVIREVNLAGALRYMWALYWLLPIELLLVLGLFDYHRVTDVWVKHWWATPSLEWFRGHFCYNSTSNTKCIVPIAGGADYLTEDLWCTEYYNATDCRQIRDDAQGKMQTATYAFMTMNGVCGLILIVLLYLALTLLQGIITAPIVASSKQTNVPMWLSLPAVGCLVGGTVFLFSPSSATGDQSGRNVFWIGVTYMTSAGTFFIAALLGWFISVFSVLSNRDKRHKKLAINCFIVTLVLTALSVAAIFSASLIYSANIVDVGFDDQTRGDVACYLDVAKSCTNCDRDVRRCPEWTTEEVVKVLQTQMKQSATLGAILSFYAISALCFGFVLRQHLSRYQIDYV
uniref:Transmembrane protein n=1 Tax=Odontella aurita TaxID=265563 RepID=A0A6U6ETL4_9STRA|mmetsp:Transcript_27518/g.80913  ORF Transcript_27518/g.80913 Transcript_27518/m.80913 type:complete len:1056 (+) Transcript_27518:111-3278(+)